MSKRTDNRGYPYPLRTNDGSGGLDIELLARAFDRDAAALDLAWATELQRASATWTATNAGFINGFDTEILTGGAFSEKVGAFDATWKKIAAYWLVSVNLGLTATGTINANTGRTLKVQVADAGLSLPVVRETYQSRDIQADATVWLATEFVTRVDPQTTVTYLANHSNTSSTLSAVLRATRCWHSRREGQVMGSVTPVYAIRFPFNDETITDVSTKNAADDMAAVLSTHLDVDRDTSLKRAAASAFRNASQSIAANTETNIQFTSEDFDTDAAINLGTNNTRITVPTSMGGRYWVFGHVASIPGTTWTSGQIALAKNGTDLVRRKYWAGSSQQISRMQVTCQVPLVPTDFLTLTVLFQGTPNPTSIDGIRFSAQRLTT
jgi:hypothetical protein